MRPMLAALAATALLLAGCGQQAAGDDPSEGTSDGANETSMADAGLAYSKCMRDHGIDMPDPQGDAGRVQLRLPEGVDPESDEFQRAEEECRPMLEGAVQDRLDDLSPEERERLQQQALALAECMREHGFDMPDPQVGSGGMRIGGPGDGSGIDPRDPEFRETMEQCHDEVGMQPPGEQGDAAGPGGGR